MDRTETQVFLYFFFFIAFGAYLSNFSEKDFFILMDLCL